MFEVEFPTVILSGGQSKRMDKNDKALITITGQTLLEIVVKRLHQQTKKVAINSNSNNLQYMQHGLPVLNDHIEGFLGPLAGILTAMKWAEDTGYKKVATVAVDTPLFPENLLKEFDKKMEETDSDIVFAASISDHKQTKNLHPVFGLWKTYLWEDLKNELEKGVRKVTLWSDRHKASSVCFTDERIDPFFNINTPDDIKLFKECLRD